MSSEAVEPKRRGRGRPPNVGVVASMRNALATDAQFEKLVKRTYALAMSGDPAALRIIWDRLMPAPRATYPSVSVALPGGDLATQAKAIATAATDGRLSADVANALVAVLAQVAGIQQAELTHKVVTLELGAVA